MKVQCKCDECRVTGDELPAASRRSRVRGIGHCLSAIGYPPKRLASNTHCSRFTFHVSRFTSAPFRTPHSALRTGFTLVEILVALGIFSLVLASIYSTWTAILRASKVGTDAAAAVQRARVVSRIFEQTLISAQSFGLTMRNHPEYYSFLMQNGDAPYLEFTAHLPGSFPRGGKFDILDNDGIKVGSFDVRRVAFSIEAGPDGSRELVLRQRPILKDFDADERDHPLVLAKNVKQFKIEVWDTRKHNDLEPWVDEWKDSDTNNLPSKVKITLALADAPHSTVVRDSITRIVRIPGFPTGTVQPQWQPIVPGGQPGLPGQLPGQVPPGQVPPGQFPPGQTQPGISQPPFK